MLIISVAGPTYKIFVNLLVNTTWSVTIMVSRKGLYYIHKNKQLNRKNIRKFVFFIQ